MGFILTLRKILGKITDVLLLGRQAGLWSKKQGPGGKVERPPHRPGGGSR